MDKFLKLKIGSTRWLLFFIVGKTTTIPSLKEMRESAQLLNDLTIQNRTRKVKSVLNGYNKQYRQKIIHVEINGRPLLFEASVVGNVKLVNYLLEECGANIEQTGFFEMVRCTPLWAAASRNSIEVVASLIEHGANVNTRSSNHRSAVSIACHSMKMLRYLVKQGADIQISDCNGRTCLMYSVHSPKICQFLLSNGAHVNQVDNKGNDALHFAMQKEYVETVKVLIKHGADIHRI